MNITKRISLCGFFLLIFASLLVCCTPDVTWSCGDLDLFDFLYAASTFSVPHAPGLPLYTMLGYIVLHLPGNEAWLLSLFLSVIPTFLTSIIIFKLIKNKTNNLYASCLGALAYPANFVVFSQSIIPEIYTITTFFIVLAYYLIEKHPKLAVIATSFGLAITYLPALAFLLYCGFYKNYRKYWYLIVTAAPLYLFLPLAIREPFISTYRNDIGAIYHFISYHGTLVLSLPVWEIPQRSYEYLSIFVVCFGIALIWIIIGLKKDKKLLWLSIPFFIYCITTLGPISYWHLLPALAFMSVALGIGVENIRDNLKIPLVVATALLLLLNVLNFNIGYTLDSSPTGARIFLNKLTQIPDESVVVTWDSCAYAGVYYFNSQNDKNLKGILPIFRPGGEPFSWEVNKYEKLGLHLFEYTQEEEDYIAECRDQEHLKGIVTEAIAITTIFSENHPNMEVYAAIPNTGNRDRREIDLVKVINGEVLLTI